MRQFWEKIQDIKNVVESMLSIVDWYVDQYQKEKNGPHMSVTSYLKTIIEHKQVYPIATWLFKDWSKKYFNWWIIRKKQHK